MAELEKSRAADLETCMASFRIHMANLAKSYGRFGERLHGGFKNPCGGFGTETGTTISQLTLIKMALSAPQCRMA
jgi:hypothetical protein